ncbi:mucin-associated surface protein (MASP), putative, partial [Trypanosoma cruzi marinkellei]
WCACCCCVTLIAVYGVAAVSFLLSLCVGGELVCAEGYTQVTGVMAMMMTGRVLLVCALCVLWCGIAGGRCDEEARVLEPPVYSTSGGASERDTGHTAPDEAEAVSAEQTELQDVVGSSPGGSQLQTPLQPESPKEQADTSAKLTDSPTDSQTSAEERQGVSPEGLPDEPGTSVGSVDEKHASDGNRERNDTQPSSNSIDVVIRNNEGLKEDTPRSAEIVDVAQSEEGEESGNATLSLEQPQGNSTATPAITPQTSSMTPDDNDNESNTVTMSEASPQTLVTANRTDTTNTQNSDGTTAASHTTSPLLLPLLVACAAAAAVVAA